MSSPDQASTSSATPEAVEEKSKPSPTTADVVESEKTRKMIVLRSNDGESFNVLESIAAKESKRIGQLIDSEHDATAVTLPNIDAPVLAKVIDIWNMQNEESTSEEDKEMRASAFVKEMRIDEMIAVMQAACYLDSKNLNDLTRRSLTDALMALTVEEIVEFFSIGKEIEEEEDDQLLRDWFN